jgi:hypothetical protein
MESVMYRGYITVLRDSAYKPDPHLIGPSLGGSETISGARARPAAAAAKLDTQPLAVGDPMKTLVERTLSGATLVDPRSAAKSNDGEGEAGDGDGEAAEEDEDEAAAAVANGKAKAKAKGRAKGKAKGKAKGAAKVRTKKVWQEPEMGSATKGQATLHATLFQPELANPTRIADREF